MTGRVSRAGAAGLLLAVGLAGGFSHRSSDESHHDRNDGLDLTASALTGPDVPSAADDEYLVSRSEERRTQVDTTASASASCDDCTADSTALHIVYLDRATDATLDNVGVAWSQCSGCRSTALSVQVVVLRSARLLRANNRALAVNAACDGCVTAAAAFQLVVVGGRDRRLSSSERLELQQWVAQQAAALRGTALAARGFSRSAAPPAATGALDQLEALVSADLGGTTTLQRDADVRTAAPEPKAGQQPGPSPGTTVDPTADPAATPTPDPMTSPAPAAATTPAADPSPDPAAT